jgi:hypothetical protein
MKEVGHRSFADVLESKYKTYIDPELLYAKPNHKMKSIKLRFVKMRSGISSKELFGK